MSYQLKRQARELALQVIYQRAQVGVRTAGEDLLFNSSSLDAKNLEFCRKLLDKTWSNLDTIDQAIQKQLPENWKQDRVSEVLNSLLRIASAELLFFKETDGKIVINESLEICRKMVGEEAVKISNGVLNAVWKSA